MARGPGARGAENGLGSPPIAGKDQALTKIVESATQVRRVMLSPPCRPDIRNQRATSYVPTGSAAHCLAGHSSGISARAGENVRASGPSAPTPRTRGDGRVLRN